MGMRRSWSLLSLRLSHSSPLAALQRRIVLVTSNLVSPKLHLSGLNAYTSINNKSIGGGAADHPSWPLNRQRSRVVQ
jgi:hypothetical protein